MPRCRLTSSGRGLGSRATRPPTSPWPLSAAYDGDLAFEARDLRRFYQVYNTGPEGIFLKRGTTATYRFDEAFPFVRRDTEPDDQPNRVYFGKAFIASVAAAPFVRLAGLNGFLLFHVVLFAGIIWLGYLFLAAQSPQGLALGYTVVFFGASITPLYAIWLTSEVFLVACVFVAYFLWFYKEVAPRPAGRLGGFLFGSGSDIVGAVVLGLAVFAKPLPSGFLIVPPVVWALTRGRLRSGVQIGAIAVVVAAAGFAVNAGSAASSTTRVAPNADILRWDGERVPIRAAQSALRREGVGTGDQRGHRGGAIEPRRARESARYQPRLLPRRTPLWLHPFLLSRRRRGRSVPLAPCVSSSVAVGNPRHSGTERHRVGALHALHLVGRGRTAGQPVFPQCLPGDVLSDAAADLVGSAGAGRSRLGRFLSSRFWSIRSSPRSVPI